MGKERCLGRLWCRAQIPCLAGTYPVTVRPPAHTRWGQGRGDSEWMFEQHKRGKSCFLHPQVILLASGGSLAQQRCALGAVAVKCVHVPCWPPVIVCVMGLAVSRPQRTPPTPATLLHRTIGTWHCWAPDGNSWA
ncbi:hypothetical protein KIL84_023330 [Mauremys mutica]|uniref:Uncharacterized protein n=1 Tax=Mauremys mutica TaxID=74926 RepID=A0A9D3WPY1_9SAUR|nr:hypothetical protein KIL84_023330 [Mauremys mutica]